MRAYLKDERMTILVNTCDANFDTVGPFFTLFNKYWKKCKYQIVLNTESKEYIDEKIINHKYSGESRVNNYGKRLKQTIKDINSPYILFFLDDFFIRDYVDENEIEKIINIMDRNEDICCFSFDKWNNDIFNEEDDRFRNYKKRSKYGKFRYNTQIAIWRKDILYASWKDYENPWQWESYGNMRSYEIGNIYVIDNKAKIPIVYRPDKSVFGVCRGKWVKEDVFNLFKKEKIKVEYSKYGFFNERENTTKNRKIGMLYSLYECGPKAIKYIILKLIIRISNTIFKQNDSIEDYLNRKYYYRKSINIK